jgi:hypothetical protein
MIGDLFVDMRIGLRIGDIRFAAQRDFANILVKTMALSSLYQLAL